MSDRSFMSIYMGAPQLDQLNEDMLAAERFREAPRLAISEAELNALSGNSFNNKAGARFVPLRDALLFESPHEPTLAERSIGALRVKTGGLAFLVFVQNRGLVLRDDGL